MTPDGLVIKKSLPGVVPDVYPEGVVSLAEKTPILNIGASVAMHLSLDDAASLLLLLHHERFVILEHLRKQKLGHDRSLTVGEALETYCQR